MTDKCEAAKQACPTLREIDALTALAPNWDSYGGKPMTAVALDAAKQVIRGMEDVDGAKSPQVVPTSPGGVQLEWVRKDFDLEIELRPDGELQLLVCPHGDCDHAKESVEIHLPTIAQQAAAITRLTDVAEKAEAYKSALERFNREDSDESWAAVEVAETQLDAALAAWKARDGK
jgi:hypothetical protein